MLMGTSAGVPSKQPQKTSLNLVHALLNNARITKSCAKRMAIATLVCVVDAVLSVSKNVNNLKRNQNQL